MYTYMDSFASAIDTGQPLIGLSSVNASPSFYAAVSPLAGELCVVAYNTVIFPTQQTVEYSILIPFGGKFSTVNEASVMGNTLYYPLDRTIPAGDCFRGIYSNVGRKSINIQLFIDPDLVSASGGGGVGLSHSLSVIYKINDA